MTAILIICAILLTAAATTYFLKDDEVNVIVIRGRDMNSIEKGKNGEREFSKFCREQGFDSQRTQQYCGTAGDGDVTLPGIHVEVKRTQKLNIYDAMAQAIGDAKGEIPIVAHRRNHDYWKVTMRAEDFFKLYRSWEDDHG